MFSDDTRPVELADDGLHDPYADFRVRSPREIGGLLRALHDNGVPLHLYGSDGSSTATLLWALDEPHGRLSFSAEAESAAVQRLLVAEEVVCVGYLERVKLQFDLQRLVLVRGHAASALQSAWPREVLRFQRRGAFRVRTQARGEPQARLRHPAMPDMQLLLRVLDVSIGGCALLVHPDVPPLQPGTELGRVRIELDADTRFDATVRLQHATALPNGAPGLRIGCEWTAIDGAAQRALQRFIDQAQKRQRWLRLDL